MSLGSRRIGKQEEEMTQEARGAAANQAAGTDEGRTEALVGRLFEAVLGAVDMVSVYIGDQLGLYRTLIDAGAPTPAELASRARIHERYAREWLEQQAVTGILEVDDAAKPERERRYSLPAPHAEALVDLDSMYSISRSAGPSSGDPDPQVTEAFRTGGGVPWSAFNTDMIESQGDFNRPWIVNLLGTEYLPRHRLRSRAPDGRPAGPHSRRRLRGRVGRRGRRPCVPVGPGRRVRP
jgi:hypothetical protein